MARSPILSVVLLLAAAWMTWNATGTLFVSQGAQAAGLRGGRTAMEAKKEEILASLPQRNVVDAQIAAPLSTGARNEVSIITPPISTEGVTGILSTMPYFAGCIIFFTFGMLIEYQRFFPDALDF